MNKEKNTFYYFLTIIFYKKYKIKYKNKIKNKK